VGTLLNKVGVLFSCDKTGNPALSLNNSAHAPTYGAV